jgi:hypothetical protein
MEMPNWTRDTRILATRAQAEIEQFADAHPDETFSFFAIRSDYASGVNVLCMDTEDNARTRALAHQHRVIKNQQRMVSHGRWQRARQYVSSQADRIVAHSTSTGYFKYDDFARVSFPEWEPILRSEGFDQHDLFQGQVILLLWTVTERLIGSGVFDGLMRSSPFRVGFDFVDDPMGLVVLRLLNW